MNTTNSAANSAANFSCQVRYSEGIAVLVISGYFSGANGELLAVRAIKEAEQGYKRLILDFSDCRLTNSPGIVSLINLGIRIKEDFGGGVVICQLDPVQWKACDMSSVFEFVEYAPNVEQAIRFFRSLEP